jgi:hypothetical protein
MNEADKNKNNKSKKSNSTNSIIKFNFKSNSNFNTTKEKTDTPKSPFNKSNLKFKSRNRRYSRKTLVNKLKNEIKKLKNSKDYYKNLCQKLSHSKVVDANFVSNNFNSSLLSSMQQNNVNPFGINSSINQHVNIFNNINPNIINNITIKNNNKIMYNSNNKESLNVSESFNTTKSQREFNIEEMTICCEIDIYYKSKYTNLEVYTLGQFSKNEELRKQVLSFIKVFLQIEKRKSQKIKSANPKNTKNTAIGNPYVNNYEFRHILSKFNAGWKRKSYVMNTPETIKSKYNQYLATLNNEKKKHKNTYITIFKNDIFNKSTRKSYSRRSKKNSIKVNYVKETTSPKKTLFNKDKANDSERVKSKNNDTTIAFLKIPTKIKTINEWENDNGNITKKSIFDTESKKFKTNSSEENKNESVFNTIKDESVLKTVKNDIYSLKSERSVSNYKNVHADDTYNEFSSKNK